MNLKNVTLWRLCHEKGHAVKRARKNWRSGLAEGVLRQLAKAIRTYDSSIATVEKTLLGMREDRRRLVDEEKTERSEFFKRFGYHPDFQDERE